MHNSNLLLHSSWWFHHISCPSVWWPLWYKTCTTENPQRHLVCFQVSQSFTVLECMCTIRDYIHLRLNEKQNSTCFLKHSYWVIRKKFKCSAIYLTNVLFVLLFLFFKDCQFGLEILWRRYWHTKGLWSKKVWAGGLYTSLGMISLEEENITWQVQPSRVSLRKANKAR